MKQWDPVIDLLSGRLFKYFAFRENEQVADDLTQETLLRLIRKIRSGHYQVETGPVENYAFGIAHYVHLEHIKKKRPTESLDDHLGELMSDSLELDEILQLGEDKKQLGVLINQLPARAQNIFYLLLEKELTLIEIAKILDCPYGTIKSDVSRAKQFIRKQWDSDPSPTNSPDKIL